MEHLSIKTPRLTKQGFVAGAAAAIAVAGGLFLRIRLRFNNHAPEELAVGLAFHQQAADQIRCHLLCRAAEEGVREGLGKGGDYWSGFCGGLRPPS